MHVYMHGTSVVMLFFGSYSTLFFGPYTTESLVARVYMRGGGYKLWLAS